MKKVQLWVGLGGVAILVAVWALSPVGVSPVKPKISRSSGPETKENAEEMPLSDSPQNEDSLGGIKASPPSKEMIVQPKKTSPAGLWSRLSSTKAGSGDLQQEAIRSTAAYLAIEASS